jgi:hypothetical protein
MARVRTRDTAPIFSHENTVRGLDQGRRRWVATHVFIFAFPAKKIGAYPT